ncbi:MAG: hypothetical protein ACI93P_001434, partial [bacterium]
MKLFCVITIFVFGFFNPLYSQLSSQLTSGGGENKIVKFKFEIFSNEPTPGSEFTFNINVRLQNIVNGKYDESIYVIESYSPGDEEKIINVTVKNATFDKSKKKWVISPCGDSEEEFLQVSLYGDTKAEGDDGPYGFTSGKSYACKEKPKRIRNLEYWKTGEIALVVPSEDKVYAFLTMDTLQYKNAAQKNLAIIKTESEFVRITSYSKDLTNTNGFVKSYGYQLNLNRLSDTDFNTPLKTEKSNYHFDQASSIAINGAKKTSTGFVAYGIDMVIFYDKLGNVFKRLKAENKLNDKFYVDVDEIGSTGLFLVTYFDASNRSFELFKYNPTTGEKSNTFQITNYNGSPDFIHKKLNRTQVHVVDENNFIVLYSLNDELCGIVKGKINKMTDSHKRNDVLIWRHNYSGSHWLASDCKDGKLTFFKGSFPSGSFIKDASRADATANSFEEFDKSINVLNGGDFCSKNTLHDIYPQKNGDYIIFSSGKFGDKFQDVEVIYHCSNNMELKGAYTMSLPLEMDGARHGFQVVSGNSKSDYELTKILKTSISTRGHHYGRVWSPSRDSYKVILDPGHPLGTIYKPIENLNSSPEQFF